MMRRVLLLVTMCVLAMPVYASQFDEVSAQILEQDLKQVKPQFRKCSSDGECTAVLSMCRWRPVNSVSAKQVADLSATVKLECKWPPPPARAPVVKCIKQLCTVPADGQYY